MTMLPTGRVQVHHKTTYHNKAGLNHKIHPAAYLPGGDQLVSLGVVEEGKLMKPVVHNDKSTYLAIFLSALAVNNRGAMISLQKL